MIAIDNHSIFNIDYLTPNFDSHTTVLSVLKQYISIINEARKLDKALHSMLDNIEFTLELNNINSVEKIDDILVKLETFSEVMDSHLEDIDFQKWYAYPLRYALESVNTSNMSLQGILGTQQALMMDRNDTTQNTKV